MTGTTQLVAFLWHQRAASIDTRERVLAELTEARGAFALRTCHRVEVYAALPPDSSLVDWAAAELGVGDQSVRAMTVLAGREAAAHLFRVAAGLDSAVAGEPQILAQLRRAYREASGPDPLVARVVEQALHVGRVARRDAGMEHVRSVGSLAVDAVLALAPAEPSVLVVGAGEMGRLAVRALARRAREVVVANRDRARAAAIADAYGVRAIGLDEVPAALAGADAVVSAADTRGALLSAALLSARIAARGPLVAVDIAVPRSVAPDARALDGLVYRSVDDLPGARLRVDAGRLAAAEARCAREAARVMRGTHARETIVAVRERAERLRRAKLDRALRRLGHLSERDRRVVEMLSTTLTSAILHAPTIALREERADPAAARVLFEGTVRE